MNLQKTKLKFTKQIFIRKHISDISVKDLFESQLLQLFEGVIRQDWEPQDQFLHSW